VEARHRAAGTAGAMGNGLAERSIRAHNLLEYRSIEMKIVN